MLNLTVRFKFIILLAFFLISTQCVKEVCAQPAEPGVSASKSTASQSGKKGTILYGQASYYANKFHGRKTANGEIFDQAEFTAACNSLPLGTWIQVTNLRNGKIIVVKTNDRLHVKTRRLLDLTRAGAQKLGYIKSGLTRVKIEVLDQKLYKKPWKTAKK
jgi:rare lipoprotein A